MGSKRFPLMELAESSRQQHRLSGELVINLTGAVTLSSAPARYFQRRHLIADAGTFLAPIGALPARGVNCWASFSASAQGKRLPGYRRA
jgi:hypothetical protein